MCLEGIGRAKGLALFWNDDMFMEICCKKAYVIDALISDSSSRKWRMSDICDWSEARQKYNTWDLISALGKDNDLPWVIRGF